MTTNRSATDRSLVAVARETFFPAMREPLSSSSQPWGLLPTTRFWDNWQHRWLALPLTMPMMLLFALALVSIPGMLQWPVLTAVLCVAWGHLTHGIVEHRMRSEAQQRTMLAPAHVARAALPAARRR